MQKNLKFIENFHTIKKITVLSFTEEDILEMSEKFTKTVKVEC